MCNNEINWLKIASNNYIKECNDELDGSFLKHVLSTSNGLTRSNASQLLKMQLPSPPTIEETVAINRRFVNQMAQDLGLTIDETIERLNNLQGLSDTSFNVDEIDRPV